MLLIGWQKGHPAQKRVLLMLLLQRCYWWFEGSLTHLKITACHNCRRRLPQKNAEWLDILVPAYPVSQKMAIKIGVCKFFWRRNRMIRHFPGHDLSLQCFDTVNHMLRHMIQYAERGYGSYCQSMERTIKLWHYCRHCTVLWLLASKLMGKIQLTDRFQTRMYLSITTGRQRVSLQEVAGDRSQWRELVTTSTARTSFVMTWLWHCWLGDRKGIRPVKSWVSVHWW